MLRPGTPVLLPPRRGWELPTYAMVASAATPHVVRVLVTATSGGRERGSVQTVPRALLMPRRRGLHRRPDPSPQRGQTVR
ncbi:hypothetical protein ACIOHE_26525 [Streptomyces sp. NPDC087851]|uniref:hypothetical protein n=1 Tax=Streptomyces sp. NPDC087851 TaxID=3365810 RepID=UPI0037F4D463